MASLLLAAIPFAPSSFFLLEVTESPSFLEGVPRTGDWKGCRDAAENHPLTYPHPEMRRGDEENTWQEIVGSRRSSKEHLEHLELGIFNTLIPFATTPPTKSDPTYRLSSRLSSLIQRLRVPSKPRPSKGSRTAAHRRIALVRPSEGRGGMDHTWRKCTGSP